MFKILEQTKEMVEYSRALEIKSDELERTTQQLQQANEQLKELDRLKADFITTVTHELRTPITSIKAFAAILQQNEGINDAQKKEFLQIVVHESERITRLINQVLDLEKLGVQTGTNATLTFDLTALCKNAFLGLKQLMEDRGINANLLLPKDSIPIEGNPDQITQVIVNLLSNAIKFCDEKAGIVQLRLFREADKAVIEVFDNGKGISEKDQQIIFEKFTQLNDKIMGKPKGSGLGLFISKTIIEQHQGHIRVISKVGEGATFLVMLPLEPAT